MESAWRNELGNAMVMENEPYPSLIFPFLFLKLLAGVISFWTFPGMREPQM